MFTEVRMRNYKAWGEHLAESGMRLGKITLLLGTNSSGKTSLLQPFRLMQQTVTAADPDLQLNLGGEQTDLVNLGSWTEVIHEHNSKESLHLGFDIQKSGTETRLDLSYRLNSSKRIVVQELNYRRGGETYFAHRQSGGGYLLGAPYYVHPLRTGTDQPDARRTYAPHRSIHFSPEAQQALGPAHASTVFELANTAYRHLEKISYLGPLRAAPRRTHQWNQQRPGNLGSDGGSAIKALLASANDRGDRDQLVKDVGRWLHRMGVADDLQVHQLGNSTHYEIRVLKNHLDCNLLDVGFGISQVLPVLTLAYFAPRNSTVIIEEPEIHLHPLAQSLLAELFVEVSQQRNIQFLIETHSEHIFRRLQFLVADRRISPDRCRLYFVERDIDGRSSLRGLDLDAYGRVSNWPKHFFGDAVGETERQMGRMMERMMQEPDRG